MLKKLTAKQEAAIPEWRDRWTAIGLSTSSEYLDEAKLRPLVNAVYKAGNLPPPSKILLVQDPLQGYLEAKKLTNSPLASYGTHDASWLAHYQFFRHVCGIKTETDLDPLADFSCQVGWWWAFDNLVIISPKPLELHLDSQGRLHKELQPAILYPSGYGVCALHGVRFGKDTRKFVLDPVDKLDRAQVLGIRNTEQRTEVIRRIGVRNFLDTLPTQVVHTSNGYELLAVELPNYPTRKYLKMRNPSVDSVHIEAVPPDCTTVESALQWRKTGSFEGVWVPPAVLT